MRRTQLFHVLNRALFCAALALTAGLTQSAARAATPTTIAGKLSQVNHVIADDQFVYWTEVTSSRTRIRKAPKGGGEAVEVFGEPRNSGAFAISYVHLQQTGTELFFTRLKVGIDQDWSIRRVNKAGGESQEILAQDIGTNPLLTNQWRVVGDRVVVVLARPQDVDLPNDTRVGVYNTNSGVWSTLITGRFQKGLTFILAEDDQNIWLRSRTPGEDTQIGRVSVTGGDGSYVSLLEENGTDTDLDEIGAVDETNLYYWSLKGAGKKHRLRKLPLAGGAASDILTTPLGKGLLESDGSLYWTAKNMLYKVSVGGGTPAKHLKKAFETAAIGGLSADNANIFTATKQAGRKFNIVRVSK